MIQKNKEKKNHMSHAHTIDEQKNNGDVRLFVQCVAYRLFMKMFLSFFLLSNISTSLCKGVAIH